MPASAPFIIYMNFVCSYWLLLEGVCKGTDGRRYFALRELVSAFCRNY